MTRGSAFEDDIGLNDQGPRILRVRCISRKLAAHQSGNGLLDVGQLDAQHLEHMTRTAFGIVQEAEEEMLSTHEVLFQPFANRITADDDSSSSGGQWKLILNDD